MHLKYSEFQQSQQSNNVSSPLVSDIIPNKLGLNILFCYYLREVFLLNEWF